MQHRRRDDRAPTIAVVRPANAAKPAGNELTEAPPEEIRYLTLDPSGMGVPRPATDPEADALLLITDPAGPDHEETGLLVVGRPVTVTGAERGAIEPAAREVTRQFAWRRRTEAWTASLEQLVLLIEHATRQTEPVDVGRSVVEACTRIAGGWAAVVYMETGSGSLVPSGGPRTPALRTGIPAPAGPAADSAAIHSVASLAGKGQWAPAFREILAHAPAARLATVTAGSRVVLVIIERRAERVFQPGDWYLLRSLARHVDATLERLLLRRQRQG